MITVCFKASVENGGEKAAKGNITVNLYFFFF